MNRGVTRTLQVLLPIAVVLIAAVGARTMVSLKPEAPTRPPEEAVPLVRVLEVELIDTTFTVHTQGTVEPRTESQLVPEVAGRIVEVSPSFVAGGFFEAGDVLFAIDPHDYERVLVQREAEIESARLRIVQEEAEAEVAQWGWDRIGTGQARSAHLARASNRQRQGGPRRRRGQPRDGAPQPRTDEGPGTVCRTRA